MEVDVYADLFFLINAGMDWLCLSVTARLLHRRVSAVRLPVAAVLGGIYAVLALLLETGQAVALAIDAAVCLLICAVAFAERGRQRRLLGATAVYVLLSMVMGGVMTALFNLLNRMGLPALLPAGEDGLGAWLFAITALVGGGCSLWGGRCLRRSATTVTCSVAVELDGRRATLRGLVDSGNLLREPLGGRAVICVTVAAVAEILSPALVAFVRAENMDPSGLSETDARRLRFIPAGTAGGGGLWPGLRPDDIRLYPDGKTDGCGRRVDAVIAILPGDLPGIVGTDGIEALVPSELI